MASEDTSTARFTPLQTATRSRRIVVLVFGPLLWLVAIVLVSVVVDQTRAIKLGLLVTLAAFVVSLGVSFAARRLRLREEQEAEQS